ncbi:hypothetical protein PSD17_04150 [Pseudonocardia sp. D17]|nr:hypothetical protein PSD17_04150 [Pseudonocardia sp. D17]
MNPAGPTKRGARISALPPGQAPIPGTGPETIDRRIYRTELRREPGGGWSLTIDAVTVAQTDARWAPQDAARWACRQMGEGVVFLNGLVGEPADSGYWVANPEAGTPAVTGARGARSRGGRP